MPVPLAVQSKRFHHQWMPDVLYLEDVDKPPFRDLRQKLESMGHKTAKRVSQGSAHSIWREPATGRLIGVADYRRGGRPAGIDSASMARWNFGGRKGVTLDRQSSSGIQPLRWTGRIAASETDGGDRFVIRRGASDQPDHANVRLPTLESSIGATIEFDGIQFAGASRNETLEFAFTEDTDENSQAVAAINLARNDRNQVVLFGRASGHGASPVAPIVLSQSPHLEQAIAIRLVANLEKNDYQIQLRRPTELDFRTIGQGKLDSGRTIRFGRLRAINDFSAPGEYVRIDAIELTPERSND